MAVVAVFLFATLPPLPAVHSLDGVDAALLKRTVTGAYHIHTTRSDGAEDKTAIAAAARRAGLQFAIFTDHGDGTRPPDPPAYLDGVLCIDAVEISTTGGHYVALGLRAATSYPLGGEPSAVVEDVHRLGGFGIVAHPEHPKPELAWHDWSLPVDGIEWINLDSEWRNESLLSLGRVLFDYALRPAPALVSVLDRPEQSLTAWQQLLRERPTVGLAAADAHGGVRGGALQEGGARYAAGPSYESAFRALTNRVILDAPLSGDPTADADRLLAAIRKGMVYSVLDGVGSGVALGESEGEPGLKVASTLPAGASPSYQGPGDRRWLEVQHPNAPGTPPVPWVVANGAVPPAIVPGELTLQTSDLGEPLRLASEWRVEKSPTSSGQVSVEDGHVVLKFGLAPGERVSQYVAAAADLPRGQPFQDITFRARADRPMRVSVQLRFPQVEGRWGTSVYLDETERHVRLHATDLVAAEQGRGTMPSPEGAGSLLFVVDLTNASPGTTGTVRITDLRASGRSPSAQQ